MTKMYVLKFKYEDCKPWDDTIQIIKFFTSEQCENFLAEETKKRKVKVISKKWENCVMY